MHEREGRDRRHRDRQRGDGGRAEIRQEEPDDDDREDRSLDQCAHGGMVGLLRVVDGREHLGNVHLGILFPDVLQLCRGALEHRHVGGALRLVHTERRRGASIQTRDRADLSDAITHDRDIAEPGKSPARQHDPRIAQRRRRTRAAEHTHRLLASTYLRSTAGRVEVELPQLLVYLDCGNTQRLHSRRVQLYAYFAIDASTARNLGHTGDGQQSFRDRVVNEPRELLFRHLGRAHGVVGDGAAVDIHATHLRF